MAAVPSKFTPPIALAVCKAVAVAAFPLVELDVVALPERAPANVVVVNVLVLGLKENPIPKSAA